MSLLLDNTIEPPFTDKGTITLQLTLKWFRNKVICKFNIYKIYMYVYVCVYLEGRGEGRGR